MEGQKDSPSVKPHPSRPWAPTFGPELLLNVGLYSVHKSTIFGLISNKPSLNQRPSPPALCRHANLYDGGTGGGASRPKTGPEDLQFYSPFPAFPGLMGDGMQTMTRSWSYLMLKLKRAN